MSRRAGTVAALALALVSATAARADDSSGVLHRLMTEARAQLDAAAKARAPKLVPPKPVPLRRQLKKLGSLDLGAPLVALVAGDLDGDHKAELYGVTSRDVVALAVDKRPRELARVAFGGDLAAAGPRDVIGTAAIEGGALIASVSSRVHGLRVTWHGRTLAGDPTEPGFEVCPGERLQLAAGRNYFAQGKLQLYGVRCRADLVDAEGYPLHVRAELGIDSRLEIAVDKCAPRGDACQPAGKFSHGEVGVAFELADLDRDGVPELIFAGDVAPGDPDTLRIASLGDDPKHPKLKRPFPAGGIAGIAAADVDGDGLVDVIVAVRLVGSTRVDLWRLE